MFLKKMTTQLLITLFEVTVMSSVLRVIFIKLDWLESDSIINNFLIGYALYQFIVYITLKSYSDIVRDGFLMVKYQADLLLIYKDSPLDYTTQLININNFSENEKIQNSIIITKEAKNLEHLLIQFADEFNINGIKYISLEAEREIQITNLDWNYSFFLRLLKQV